MDGDLGGWARKKSCDFNEGPGYIYCISGWNKVSFPIFCVVLCQLYKIAYLPMTEIHNGFLWSGFF